MFDGDQWERGCHLRRWVGKYAAWRRDPKYHLELLLYLTIFVACWTVLHLNLHSPGERLWQTKLRKAKWMVVALVVPELLTALAFAQRVAARESVQVMTALGYKWTL